ncbi:hypothetical protein AOLI_G00090480 [Acnodon oligacanthus]
MNIRFKPCNNPVTWIWVAVMGRVCDLSVQRTDVVAVVHLLDVCPTTIKVSSKANTQTHKVTKQSSKRRLCFCKEGQEKLSLLAR